MLRNGARALGVQLTAAQLGRFRLYSEGLLEWNRRSNLTSSKALEEVGRVHFLDSLTLVPLIRRHLPDARTLADVGPGGGFPGVPVKLALPHLRLVLVEATGKKAEFLRWLVAELQLADVEVVSSRAEEMGHLPAYRERFDVATARALGSLSEVLELTLPLCRTGGLVIAPRGGDAAAEVEASTHAQEVLGGRVRAIEPGLEAGSALVVVEKVASTPSQYPRRPGMPGKRPL